MKRIAVSMALVACAAPSSHAADWSNTSMAYRTYRYATDSMLGAVWVLPVGATGLSFEGFANVIAAKGRNEFGRGTKPETSIDMQLMVDVGAVAEAKPKRFRAGLAYQYWRNKFGNDAHTIPGRLPARRW